ncbi:MAG: carboxypeptidase-like regulatory domain-containing protein [Bacteroidota bacterium]|nr:carboxypeptidase-like regulatory domain-containing protein [Bacteroidota bacterium]
MPLPSVSVYLNSTSIGTITNEKGLFVIGKVPSGKFRLVATCIGYETYDTVIDIHSVSNELVILLKTKQEELQSFSVLPADPNGWEKYGKYFTQLLLGNTLNSNNCKLMNPEVIKLRLNADNTLVAFAKEPLMVMNYALGYEIKYKLEDFECNLTTSLVSYSGYSFYKDMAIQHPNRTRRYTEARFEAYRGSLLHFMRAFYANDLATQGFEMRSLGKISNPEKDRAKKLFSQHRDSVILDTTGLAFTIHISPNGQPYISTSTEKTEDSADYFKKRLLEPDSIISHQLITSDSIGFAADSTIAGLYFQDSLEVSYKLKDIPPRYRALSKEHKHETYPISQFVFVNKTPVFVIRNGFYYKPYDLKITGYWAWFENMSTWLPFDYVPGNR